MPGVVGSTVCTVRSCGFALCLCHHWNLWPWLNHLASHNFGFCIHKIWIIAALLPHRVAVQIKGNNERSMPDIVYVKEELPMDYNGIRLDMAWKLKHINYLFMILKAL